MAPVRVSPIAQAVIGSLPTLRAPSHTIRHADVIFVFNDYELAEQRTHESLLAGNGIYAELHRLQNPDGATIGSAEPAA